MNDLSSLHPVGWDHTGVCHKTPHLIPGTPHKKFELTLNLVGQVGYFVDTDDNKYKVYTPMDVDEPGIYNAVNVDEPRVYTPMDVDETWVTAWCQATSYESSMDGNPQAVDTSAQTLLRVCRQGVTVYMYLDLTREWESWDSGSLANQKLIYEKKWAIIRHNKQHLFPFQFRHIPWPIFRSHEKCFIFGEARGNPPTSESRRLIKRNLNLFHPDKFALALDRVLPMDRKLASDCAEVVCRVLTRHLD
ncbi:hypothetical protein B0H13DRAFT_1861595 [Mycena leptocephala]|nr:hypothetical protein B0H13DRAFT_1861595 [Mycena leptocephala]